MSIEMNTDDGSVTITNDVIVTLVGGTAVESYGIVGMASKNQIRDGITEILRKDNYARGVVVRKEENDIHIDMYIIVSYGTKISEIANNVQSQVKYRLKQILGIDVASINIYVQGVKAANQL